MTAHALIGTKQRWHTRSKTCTQAVVVVNKKRAIRLRYVGRTHLFFSSQHLDEGELVVAVRRVPGQKSKYKESRPEALNSPAMGGEQVPDREVELGRLVEYALVVREDVERRLAVVG
jgi:hypothetical protein